MWSWQAASQGFPLLQPCEKCLKNLFYFTQEHTRSHWQMSDIKQKFCPEQSTGCLGSHVACHSLGLQIFMPSISLFFSLKFTSFTQAQKERVCAAGNFQGGCRGSHKAAPRLPNNIPVFLPGWEQMRRPECLTGCQRSRRAAAMSLSVSLHWRIQPQRPGGYWCSQCVVWQRRKGNSSEVCWTHSLSAALEES